MGVANDSEKARVAAVDAQSTSDEWRATGKKTAWEAALAQDEWQPWQQADLVAGHKKVMDEAATRETGRTKAINAQETDDAWRSARAQRSLAQKQVPKDLLWQPW